MKNSLIYICILLLLISCNNDTILDNIQSGNNVVSVSKDFEYDNIADASEPQTRSTIFLRDNGTVGFKWEADDEIAIFTEEGNCGFFHNQSISADGLTANFTGGGFDLITDKDYYAFSKSSAIKNQDLNPTANMNHVGMTYEGQRMVEDNSMAGLGDFDYQTASATGSSGHANFDFKHLGCVFRAKITLPAVMEDESFTKLELHAADNYDFAYERWIDLEDEASGLQYNTPDESPAYHSFGVNLGPESGEGISKKAGELLTVYMMLPASDELKDKSVYGILTAVSGRQYYISFTGKEYVGGKAYSYARTATKVDGITVNISVDAMWESGQTQALTRAASTTGDVGNSELDTPEYMYIFMINNGKVCQVENISGISATDWNFVGNRWVYKNAFVPHTIATVIDVKAYIVASASPVSFKSSVNIGDSETKVQELLFTSSVAEQAFLANLYSTPYLITGFTGEASKVGSAWVINASLRHVAAKVDLNWESETSVVNGFSVNNLLEEGLVFNPTQNAVPASGAHLDFLTTPATEYNGRQCIYTIQQNNAGEYPLNITWNKNSTSGVAEDIIFTPTSTYGSASWLKAKITVE